MSSLELAMSVVIPAYNEESRLPTHLRAITEYFDAQRIGYEVIVIDDGSTDSTAAMVKQFMTGSPHTRLIQLPLNRGKGHAVKNGMLNARGRLRLYTDADGATPIAEVDRLIKAIDSGSDVAIGSRAKSDHSCRVKAHLHRKVLGSVFNALVRTLVVRGICDTQCGFKLFTDKAALALFPLQQLDGFGFDVELLFLGRRYGFQVAEVPVNWTDVAGSKVRLVRDSFRMLCDVLRVRSNCLLGCYPGRIANSEARGAARTGPGRTPAEVPE